MKNLPPYPLTHEKMTQAKAKLHPILWKQLYNKDSTSVAPLIKIVVFILMSAVP